MSESELQRLRMENTALYSMLEAATEQIHGEWGSGPREPYDWLPEMEQHICGQKGHRPGQPVEKRWSYNNRNFHRRETFCKLCGALTDREDLAP